MFDPEWIKSSCGSQDGGDFVEWAPSVALATGTVPVRDSKAPVGPHLAVSSAAWQVFVNGVGREG
ncbi:DUF397 domain-containing protein [Streptomyces albidoflavus]|uniref:DUF397 domain-containing protein n=1 Tax=Streptomyces albidoflavus TaxID=1886 RepID=UPI00101E3F4E|nr:DUF397 domain-containing protein [Streptomyces albidoflavus]RZE89710.1 DUF397 domain-containing protein [Streptomyces albidoflavus]RZE91391.1 DUF397 domain-containing protein [Streptomyces albidoflavus]